LKIDFIHNFSHLRQFVGTHLPQEIREKTQKLAPKLKLLNGGLI